jgi:hypothetical protein
MKNRMCNKRLTYINAMKNCSILLLLCCVSTFSYAETRGETKMTEIDFAKETVSEEYWRLLHSTQREKKIVNNKFVEEVSEKMFDWKRVKSVYSQTKIIQTTKPNIHWPELNDMTETITEGQDSLKYQVDTENAKEATLLEATVFSHKLDIPFFLVIGQPLSLFHQKFHFYDDIDVLSIELFDVVDTTAVVKLIFSNRKLKTILYQRLYTG